MKAPKLFIIALALAVSLNAYSQQPTTTSENTKKDTSKASWGTYPPTHTNGQQPALNNNQQSPNHQTFPAPNFGNFYIPVLGTYTSSENNTTKTISITGDEKNVGKVWIEGLSPVKFYALLKAVPGTYKIPTQKQEEKQIQEGTLVYDETNKQINICLGCGFKDPRTTDIVTEKNQGKNKNKSVINFTGVKNEQGTVRN